jgi:NADPH-dependent 2,4-dienoyl-CoA reductase/sulfur reductase-like enzyme
VQPAWLLPPPPHTPHKLACCWCLVKVLELEELPRKVTLIGGGYIGMEFAGMFQRLGCEVHVVARQALPLAPRFDAEVGGGSGRCSLRVGWMGRGVQWFTQLVAPICVGCCHVQAT